MSARNLIHWSTPVPSWSFPLDLWLPLLAVRLAMQSLDMQAPILHICLHKCLCCELKVLCWKTQDNHISCVGHFVALDKYVNHKLLPFELGQQNYWNFDSDHESSTVWHKVLDGFEYYLEAFVSCFKCPFLPTTISKDSNNWHLNQLWISLSVRPHARSLQIAPVQRHRRPARIRTMILGWSWWLHLVKYSLKCIYNTKVYVYT